MVGPRSQPARINIRSSQPRGKQICYPKWYILDKVRLASFLKSPAFVIDRQYVVWIIEYVMTVVTTFFFPSGVLEGHLPSSRFSPPIV